MAGRKESNFMTTRTIMNGKPVFTVPAKTIINFKSHFDKKLLCNGMTFSTGVACVYSCSFCYVDSMMKKQQEWLTKNGVTGEHMAHVVRRENAVEILRQQIMSKPVSFREKKQVIYSSPLVDVAGNMDLVKETVEICREILSLTNWDIRLLSKSNLLPKVAQALSEYTLNANRRIIYGVSTGTLDDKLASAFEEGTPKVSKRIESLHWLQDNGYRTFGMICPSLPQRYYPDFAMEMAKAIRVDRCEHVWAEVINVRGDSFKRTFAALTQAEFNIEAHLLDGVSNNKAAWEEYARKTFEAHTGYIPASKLRFLQYVTKDTEAFWKSHEQYGAVLL